MRRCCLLAALAGLLLAQNDRVTITGSVSGDVDWWQGRESNRLPELWTWNVNLQREIHRGLLLEADTAPSLGRT